MTLTIERTKEVSVPFRRQATRASCVGHDDSQRESVEMPPVMKNPPVDRELTIAECLDILRWLKADLAAAAKEAGLR